MVKLLIIDGHALVFRAYFAFQTANLKNSKTGKPSGAVFGFFKMLFKIIQDFSPTHVAMTFDPGTKLKRSEVFPQYKANRSPMPDDLRPQIGEVIEITREIGFPILQVDGEEADDIIGTLCDLYDKKGNEIIIFSGDKDLFQLLDGNVTLLRGKKGATEFVEINKKWVETEVGVSPKQIPDYMGIVGDTSDNIPGVKGIGEKGASKLISEFSNLETIYKKIEDVKNPSMKTKLLESKENAFLSRDLATLNKQVPLHVNLNDLLLPEYYHPTKVEFFKERGYNVLSRDLGKFSEEKGYSKSDSEKSDSEPKEVKKEEKKINSAKGNYVHIKTLSELKTVLKEISKAKLICVDTETTSKDPMLAEILGVSFSIEEQKGYYVSLSHPKSFFNSINVDIEEALKLLKPILENPKIVKIGQNIKYDLLVLSNYGIEISPISFDTMLASYILHPESRRHGMDDLAEDFLEYKTITYDDLTGTGKKRKELFEVEPERVAEYAAEDADITLRLYNTLKPMIEDHDKNGVLEKIEVPLIFVLKEMEKTGILIDKPYFQKLSKDFQKELQKQIDKIYKVAGKEFNIASTKELQKVLFEDLKLPTEKKTQTGFSTDHSVLESLRDKHPIIEMLLNHRKYSKLLNTYIDVLPLMINPKTGRIHTNYNQTIAVTGRLSSTDPNLQNIPIKDDEGKLIRRGFIAKEDHELLSLDYSQIELRIMAHFSNDKRMLEAYENNLDIHTRTAAALYSVDEALVTSEMRSKAKAVNFSVIYGTTAFGLAQNLRISRTEAKIFIDKYFLEYPGVKKFMDEISNFCMENEFVETLTGRRRYVPEIKSTNRQDVEAAKRVAINSPIQGTSADMIKLAMINIQNTIEKKKLSSRMLLQVHDELVFEVPKKEKETIFAIAKKEMETVLKLKVPIVVQGKFGKNWDEAH
ncbi:MAG: DNA polymerase I [Leptospiraceae bacterium]|nr:DNA polymerase I [Leptospiraceae bacterium]